MSMTINITAKGMELTSAIQEYAREKVESLETFFDGIIKVDVIVGMESHHHNKGKIYFAEMNVHVPGNSVFVKKEAADLYKAIDKVKDHLKVDLEKTKSKMRQIDRGALREQKAYQEDV